MAITANIKIDQGTDFSASIDVKTTNGLVYNLTGYIIAAQMRKSYYSSVATSFTTSHNGVGGQIKIILANVVTNLLVPGRYLYDVEITDPSGHITRVVEGIVTVAGGITRI